MLDRSRGDNIPPSAVGVQLQDRSYEGCCLSIPLPSSDSDDAIELIREQILRCEAEDVAVLSCPEAILGREQAAYVIYRT